MKPHTTSIEASSRWPKREALYLATSFGVPVSTTHTITGAIMGVGAARKVSAVRWGIAGSIIIAWVITLPAAAVIGALFYECVTLFAATD